MTRRDARINEEAAALWCELHHTPPPAGCEGVALIERAIATSDPAEYDRLQSAWLRDRNLTWPVGR